APVAPPGARPAAPAPPAAPSPPPPRAGGGPPPPPHQPPGRLPVAPRAADQPVILILVVKGDDLELLVVLVGTRPPRRQRPGLLAPPPALLFHIPPPRRLFRVGHQRHHHPIAADVQPGRARRRPAVRRRPADGHLSGPLGLEHTLALGLHQHPEGLATDLHLGGPRQVGRRLVEVLAVGVEPAGHLAHPQADRALQGVQPQVQRRGRPLPRAVPAPPPDPHPAVDRQDGEVL